LVNVIIAKLIFRREGWEFQSGVSDAICHPSSSFRFNKLNGELWNASMKGKVFAKALNMLPDVPHLVWSIWIRSIDVQDCVLHPTKPGNVAFDFEAPLGKLVKASPISCNAVSEGLLALS